MLRCNDRSYDTGVTNSIERRVSEHTLGLNPKAYTYTRRPVTLVYSADFDYVLDAISHEKRLKGWSRKKKEAIIRGNFHILPALSGCKNEWHSKNVEQNKRMKRILHYARLDLSRVMVRLRSP